MTVRVRVLENVWLLTRWNQELFCSNFIEYNLYAASFFPDFRINKSKKLFVRFYSNDAKNSNVKHSHGVLGPKV